MCTVPDLASSPQVTTISTCMTEVSGSSQDWELRAWAKLLWWAQLTAHTHFKPQTFCRWPSWSAWRNPGDKMKLSVCTEEVERTKGRESDQGAGEVRSREERGWVFLFISRIYSLFHPSLLSPNHFAAFGLWRFITVVCLNAYSSLYSWFFTLELCLHRWSSLVFSLIFLPHPHTCWTADVWPFHGLLLNLN